MNKHKDPLKKLYKLFPDLKDKLTAILNHPLMPSEFEDAWKALIEEYNLHDINVMINLWAERKLWISAYWKEVFCARMTSTQRSESMNFVLKRGFVTERDNLHIFAKQVNNCIQARHEAENAEANASTGTRKTVTRYGFEAQVMDKYTRAVYSVFRERQYHSTAFRIKTSQDNPNIYLVHHYNQSKEFAWSRHEFRVLADEVEGRYECECKLWEHTGLFCHHVIAVFEHLRLDEIPSKDANTNLDNEDAEPDNNEDAEMENNENAEMENNEQSSNQENTTRETGEHNDIP
nr:protein FAR1-RELATED SEQUENCE 5-like [Lolium perenne]